MPSQSEWLDLVERCAQSGSSMGLSPNDTRQLAEAIKQEREQVAKWKAESNKWYDQWEHQVMLVGHYKQGMKNISMVQTDKGPTPDDDRGGALAIYAQYVLSNEPKWPIE